MPWNKDDPLEAAIDENGRVESKRAHSAACAYCLMGPGRSYRKLLEQYKQDKKAGLKPPTTSWNTLSNWAATYHWVERANRFDELQLEKALAVYESGWKEKVMGATEVIGRLSDMGRASLEPFVNLNPDGTVSFDFSGEAAKDALHLIKKIKTKRTRRVEGRGENAEEWEDEYVEIELHDAQSALVNIGRHHMLFVDQQKISGSLDLPISADDLDQARKAAQDYERSKLNDDPAGRS